MSGVRNLRAMFEQKGDTSPPSADDRGRSPGAGSTGTESPRPISRIRTNFIAIEKDGRLGLQIDNSRDSSVSGVSTRKLSGDLETPSLSRTVSHDNTSAPAEARPERTPIRRTSLKEQTIPESPRTDSAPQMPDLPLPKSPNGKALAPPINPDKTVDEEEVNTTMAVGGPTDKSAMTGDSLVPGTGKTSNGISKEKSKDNSKTGAKEHPKPAVSTTKSANKTVAPVNTAGKTAAKPTKSPTATKPMRSPATATVKLAGKAAEKKAGHPEKSTAPKASTSTASTKSAASLTSGTSSAKKPPALQPTTAGTGFVKPKVKSPTRPVKLPVGLTTHTAASATKFNVSRETRESRQSLPATSHDAERHGRSHSRASISTAGTRSTAAAAGKNLKRQSSTVSRSRPSIGPPPKQASKDDHATKKETHVDESFLARMMRPTAASASKTHEKPPVTPPRKIAAAPSKKPAHKPESKHTEAKHTETKRPVTKQPDTKLVKATDKSVQPTARVKTPAEDLSPAKKVAPVVENVATAEEAVEVAKEIDGPAELPQETANAPSATEEGQEPQQVDNQESKPDEKKEQATTVEAALPVEKTEDTPVNAEAAKTSQDEVAEPSSDEAAPSTNPGPEAKSAAEAEAEAPKHDVSPQQDEAPPESEAAEEAPSEATLVNGANDKTAVLELTGPEAAQAGKEDEGKTVEGQLSKEEVTA